MYEDMQGHCDPKRTITETLQIAICYSPGGVYENYELSKMSWDDDQILLMFADTYNDNEGYKSVFKKCLK